MLCPWLMNCRALTHGSGQEDLAKNEVENNQYWMHVKSWSVPFILPTSIHRWSQRKQKFPQVGCIGIIQRKSRSCLRYTVKIWKISASGFGRLAKKLRQSLSSLNTIANVCLKSPGCHFSCPFWAQLLSVKFQWISWLNSKWNHFHHMTKLQTLDSIMVQFKANKKESKWSGTSISMSWDYTLSLMVQKM